MRQNEVALLKQGVNAWNAWRQENPDLNLIRDKHELAAALMRREVLGSSDSDPYLSHADLSHADLRGADLVGADLSDAMRDQLRKRATCRSRSTSKSQPVGT